MRIMIVSDTHGRHGSLNEALEREGKLDMLLHLGDVEDGEHYIEAAAQCPVHILSGNNDFFSYLPGEKEIKIGKYRIFMTHGHGYYVSMNTQRLRREAIARDVDIVMFGHTHKPYLDLDGDVVVLNPGSIAYPRQEGRQGTYIMMETDCDGNARFELKYV